MNCKRYRACLAGLIAVAFICGVLWFAKCGKENQIPENGILVQETTRQDGMMEWA